MISIAIQAGGQSSRMGRDKGLIELGGKPLVEHLIQRLQGLGDELLITTNQPDDYAYLELPLFPDPIPGAGAAQGLQTALKAAAGDVVLVVACDMPFVQPALGQYLLGKCTPGIDVVVPVLEERYEPMLAVYRRQTCLLALNRALNQGQRRLIDFYPFVRVLKVEQDDLSRVDPANLSFFNINTPTDLKAAEKILADGE